MIKGKKCVAVIPARSGSKGVKDKNIKLLNNKPLIAHTIEFAKSSDLIDNVIVSTDSEKYAEIAKNFGAEVPFIRPDELSQDTSKGIDVDLHAINWIVENIKDAEYYFRLQPTSPFRESIDVIEIVDLFQGKNADAIVSLCEVDHPPHWMYTITKDSKLKNLFGIDVSSKNRQELDRYYRVNGAFYFAKIKFLIKYKSFFTDNTYPYIMPRIRSVDIDTELDLEFANFLIKSNLVKNFNFSEL